MPTGFRSFQYHISQVNQDADLERLGPRADILRPTTSAEIPSAALESTAAFENDEAAARYYLNHLLVSAPGLESLAAEGKPVMVPELRRISVSESEATNTRLVRFRQEQSRIPVFGSNIVIELDKERNFVSADIDVADIERISPFARLSPAQALYRISTFAHKRKGLDKLSSPELLYLYHEETDSWRLAYHFVEVPVSPPDFLEAEEETPGFGIGGPPTNGRFSGIRLLRGCP